MASSSSSSSSATDNSRTYFWHYIVNEEGQPIQNAEVRLYLDDDPTIEATIFLTEVSILSTTCSVADIKTDNDGFFAFWLGNEFEDGGHSLRQEFRLEWFKAGTAPGLIKEINPWPNAFAWQNVNTGADRDYKNKFVSDYLANKWWTHFNAHVPSASPHDLYPVDYESGCDDDRYNKVVSNKFVDDIWDWCVAEGTETVENQSVFELQQSLSWTASGDTYWCDISHPSNIGQDVLITLVKLDKQILPKKIINVSSAITRIVVDHSVDLIVNMQGYMTFTFLLHDAADSDSAQGVILETVGSQSDLGATFGYVFRSAMLSDQRVVVVGYDTDNSANEVRCFEAGTTTLDWSYEITGYELYIYGDICVLNNGNIVVVWGDYNDEYIYFVILNSSGGLVQGVTHADTSENEAYEDEGFSVTALEDGGFFIRWLKNGGSAYGSLWNSDGTNRQVSTWLEGTDDVSAAIQFASGSIVVFDIDNEYCTFYSPTDLTEGLAFNVFTNESHYEYIFTAKLSSWTNKIAIVFGDDSDIYGNIIDDTGTILIDDKTVLAGATPTSFMSLPNGTFLMQFRDGATEYSQSYYILDEDLDIVSGPTVAFTGITEDTYYYYLKGAAL